MPVRGAELAVYRREGDSPAGMMELVYAHGWGQTHHALLPLAEALQPQARPLLVDLPGFGGASPEPPGAWSTADYADAAAEWLAGRGTMRRVWVGYSYGGRVGLQLAARHPEMLDGLCLIATPGLPPRHSAAARIRVTVRRLAFRLARRLTSEGPARERLRARFGSSDYAQATPLMRQVLVKAVNEDLSAAARAIRLPVLLIYGDQDRDAPADIGMRFNAMMPSSRLVVLRGFGHLDIITDGHHQLVQRLGEFIGELA